VLTVTLCPVCIN